jgi:hypothetical protein
MYSITREMFRRHKKSVFPKGVSLGKHALRLLRLLNRYAAGSALSSGCSSPFTVTFR